MVTIQFELKPKTIEMLDRVVEHRKKKKPETTRQLFLFGACVRETFRNQSRLYTQFEADGELKADEEHVLKYDTLPEVELGDVKTGSVEMKISEHTLGQLTNIVSMIRGTVKMASEEEPSWKTLRDWLELVATQRILDAHAEIASEEADEEAVKEYGERTKP